MTPVHLPDLPGIDIPEADEAGRAVRVVVLGREGCHLCEVAAAVVARVAEQQQVGWVERSATASPAVLQRYAEQVPVVFVDGAVHAYWRVEPDRLTRALRRRWWRRLLDFVPGFTRS